MNPHSYLRFQPKTAHHAEAFLSGAVGASRLRFAVTARRKVLVYEQTLRLNFTYEHCAREMEDGKVTYCWRDAMHALSLTLADDGLRMLVQVQTPEKTYARECSLGESQPAVEQALEALK